MKVGLYSITYLGIWYKGGALSLRDFIAQAKRLGYDGVEIDGKRPHGNPMDLSAGARREIRSIAAGEGIEIPAVASNNDFTSPIPDYRECQILMVREQIKLAADLGARVVRIFLAWPGVTYRANGLAQYDIARRRWEEVWRDHTRAELWDFAKAALKEVAHVAEEEGVVLALQNHAPVIRHYQDILDMIAEVDSPAFRACMDVPIEPRQDDEWVWQMARATGDLQAHSHFGGEYVRAADGAILQRQLRFGAPLTNYPTFVKAMKEIGYDGYLCYELCHPFVDARHEPLGIEAVHEQAALAVQFMRDLIASS